MNRFSIPTAIFLAMLVLAGCESTGPQTGFQKSMQTVGRGTWAVTKATGFGLGYMTQKLGQGIALAGHGVAAGGGALQTATGL